MVRVIFNQFTALGQKTGVGHYTRQLYRRLVLQAGEDRIDAFPTGWVRRACRTFASIRPYLDTQPRAARPTAPMPAGLRKAVLAGLRRGGRRLVGRYLRALCANKAYDLYHEPNLVPFDADCPTVATLHDLSVLLHPEWHPADRVAFYERYFQRGLKRAVHFLTVSEFSRQEVIRILGVSPERVTRTYNGIRPGLRPLPEKETAAQLEELGLPPRYLLCVGTIEPRKNILMLLKAYASLPERLRSRWPLILVGNWGWNSGDVADYFHREARHRGVIHLGYVRERSLSAVYNGARALLFPSFYEGFGLPPLEMMACGGAVLASTAGAVVEAVGQRADLIPPEDRDAWRRAMARVLRDDDWWQTLRRGVVALAQTYTWERCAEETLGVYRTLAGVPAATHTAAPERSPARVRVAG